MHAAARSGIAGLLALLVLPGTAAERDPPAMLLEAAVPQPVVPGAPRESDVTMRTLARRDAALDAIRDFHVTRLEWTYADADFIARVRGMGVVFGGASSTRHYLGDEPREVWNVRDLEGNLVIPHWKREWPQPTPYGCANHPEFRRGYLRFLKDRIDAGADVLQRDEPFQNISAPRWGGCFCGYCMEGFSRWLAGNADPAVLERLGVGDLDAFNYADYLRERDAPSGDDFGNWPGDELKGDFVRFQTETTLEFHRWWRRELNEYAGRHVPVSCNNGVRHHRELEQLFDYWLGELNARDATPESLYAAMRRAREYGKTQTTTMPLHRHDEATPEWIRLIRQTLATAYAAGGHMQMPWDTYLPTPDARRFFGEPEDSADLSAFIRASAPFLDGYADAAAAGGDIDDARWPADRAPVKALADSVYAFARVRPGEPEAPVVVHLVDWRPDPRPFRVTIRPEAFFGGRPLRFRLFTPVAYEREAHKRAFETGDYRGMARETGLEGGFVTGVEIPALNPWGILVVEPATGEAETGVWQPILRVPDDDPYHPDRIRVVMSSPTEGAQIRYTTDGSEPTDRDRLYVEPVVIREEAEIRARAFLGDARSRAASLSVRRATPAPPDTPLLFDGEDDAVIVNDERDLYRLTAYTYSFWIQALEGPTGRWRQVFTKGMVAPQSIERGPSAWLRPNDMRINFSHSTGDGRVDLNSREIPVGEWTHVALVSTGPDGEMLCFLNGEAGASVPASGLTAQTQSSALWIGNGPNHPGVRARMHDFRVYGRPLCEDRIRDLYQGREVAEGLVGWWTLRDDTGRTVEDRAGNNAGRMVRAPRRWTLDP